ncbi:MAG: threonylcarbamoyl-AMP synthase [Thermoprotei archaeon]|nr:MAG: threonylcarbamoyl-AMP synthase [Thermoprotei archaeon]
MKPRVIKVAAGILSDEVLREVAQVVKSGGLIIYPTDTVYGLGADPLNEQAIRRVYAVKRREQKPLPVLVSSIERARELVYVTPEAEKLMRAFWPGPLTIVLRKREHVPSTLTAGRNSLGVRQPNMELTIKLIEYCGGYLIGTSANISGHPAPRTAEEAMREIGMEVDVVIDAGPCPGGIPSTVIDLTTQPPRVVREGPIKREQIKEILGVEIT